MIIIIIIIQGFFLCFSIDQGAPGLKKVEDPCITLQWRSFFLFGQLKTAENIYWHQIKLRIHWALISSSKNVL